MFFVIILIIGIIITYFLIKKVNKPTSSDSQQHPPIEINPSINNKEEKTDAFSEKQKTARYKENSVNPKFHKTPDETRLRIKFATNNKEWLKEYEDKIYNNSLKSNDEKYSVEKQINFCTEAINAFNALKKICYNREAEGGKIYFQNMWEYCHNSQNPCFSYIDRIIERRDYLVKYYDILSDFSNIIIETIKNNPGLLQKNIYSLINIDLKSEIQKEIRTLEQSGLITRTPKSGTYILEVKSASLGNSADSIKTTNTAQEIEKNSLPQTLEQLQIKIDLNNRTELTAGLLIPDEVLNLLWVKGGPLDNYTSIENNKSYNTNGVRFSSTYSTEPSLIDTSLLLDTDICSSDFMEDIGYYPSYEKLTPKQRYVYLSWLQNISQPVAIGYVFIYYYGLERHLLFGKYKEAAKMIAYLQQFHKNNSFNSYSTDAILIAAWRRNDPTVLSVLNTEKANNSVFAFIKAILQKGYTAKDIIRLHKDFGFTNNRYIKNQYDDFYNAVTNVLLEEYGAEFYPITVNAIKNCKKNQTLAIANYSLTGERFAAIPDIASNTDICNSIYNILSKAHETVKINNRKNRTQKKSEVVK